MFQLEPREYFTISRQLDDPTDTATYYVRAEIRKAIDDSLIDTVDLEDVGGQRFRKKWQVPADPSGQGFYIVITTKVYTDNGYTNVSPNYGIDEKVYLVQKRYNPVLGAGGGVDVDYKKVRKIIQEEIKKIPKVEIPKAEKVDLSSVYSELREIKRRVEGIKIPELKVDLSEVIKELRGVKEAVNGIEIPEPEKIDLSPILDRLDSLENDLRDIEKKSALRRGEEMKKLSGLVEDLKNTLKNGLPLKLSLNESTYKKRSFI